MRPRLVGGKPLLSLRLIYSVLSGLIFFNLIYGPLVRATDSGLACPDWPLCHGKAVPDFNFQIFMEVGHRYYSGILGLLVIGAWIWVMLKPETRKRYGVVASLSVLFLGTQVALGALTVTKLLDPKTVNLHLLNAILLLTLTMTIALSEARPGEFQLVSTGRFLLPLGGTILLYQIFLGAKVSSNYAGLACPDFPTCYGRFFPEMLGTIRYQMEHRYFGYLAGLVVLGVSTWSILQGFSDSSKRAFRWAAYLILFQIVLGAVNVLYHLPKGVTALHTVNAALIFELYYAGCFFHFRSAS